MSKEEVTTVIYHRVKKADMDAYREWQPRIEAACRTFDGYEDIQLFEPGIVTENENEFVLAIRFSSRELLKKWIDSDIRRDLLREAEDFTIGKLKVTVFSGLEHWFADGDSPPRYKMTLVTFLAIWPLVHFVPPGVNRLLDLGKLGNEFIATAIIVLTMSYLVLPLMCRLFGGWLKT